MLSKEDREELEEVIENDGDCPRDEEAMAYGCNDDCIIFRLTQSHCLGDGDTLQKAKELLRKDAEDMKDSVAETVAQTPKLYHTPCGDFMEGETIKAPVGERIFLAYAPTLAEPYICLIEEYEKKYKNKEVVDVICWHKIEKLPTKKYEPFTEPNLEWIGTFIKGKKDGMVSRIVGFENDRGDWQVLCKNLEALNKTLCSESTESIPLESASFDGLFEYYTLLDGTPFGKEVTNE